MNHLIEQELKKFKQEAVKKPEFFDVHYVIEQYSEHCLQTINNPFDVLIIDLIKSAITNQKPFSLVRVGDGEANILTFSKYKNTPNLNYFVAEKSVDKRAHSFKVSKTSLFILEQLMTAAVNSADVLGVLGLWRPKVVSVEHFLNNKSINLRGLVGHWRGVDYLLKLGKENQFDQKVVTTAHCYFSIVEHLELLLSSLKGEQVLLINNQLKVLGILSDKFPRVNFKSINLSESLRPLEQSEPYFLYEVYQQLPSDLSGVLVLIGAGPWAELYCHWVKEKGGVGVDLGTGFDLIAGKNSRPIHRQINQYKTQQTGK